MIINLNNNRRGDWNQDDPNASDYIKNRPVDLLKYTSQSLDDSQKSQARSNIDAAASNHSHTSSDVGVYVQDSEPTNALQNELWIDTSTEILNAEGASF